MSPSVVYAHTEGFCRPSVIEPNGLVRVHPAPQLFCPISHALHTLDIAVCLGVKLPSMELSRLPYDKTSDSLTFDAPLISSIFCHRIRFLRGWKQYSSCVKGFNALGLMAEPIMREKHYLSRLTAEELKDLRLSFLRTRQTENSKTIFREAELRELSEEWLEQISLLDLALWRAFATKVIVCSTSSNMGISLHEALRFAQNRTIQVGNKRVCLFNQDEGKLIIWCPDEKADFMNAEKMSILRSLERETPTLTELRTYINRTQRDPNALSDALRFGGYFFPTNPQSIEEMQSLFNTALHGIAKEDDISFHQVLQKPNISSALQNLGAMTQGHQILVTRGIEGGLYGLMVPYLVMLEETLQRGGARAVSTWNQASIGAALAAIVLCDSELQNYAALENNTKDHLKRYFPKLVQALNEGPLKGTLSTRIHGVFDSANLQSLAQLFGVQLERHLTGRGTAFVGLGSSSYANGNLCFSILQKSTTQKGAFRGREALHAATHTVNPIAQALIYAEEFNRVTMAGQLDVEKPVETEKLDLQIAYLLRHVRKPEPAGAAALAGYLLTRLDSGTLSYLEIALGLRKTGFSRRLFLQFIGFGDGEYGASWFIQGAYEEGSYMGGLAEQLLNALDWPLDELSEKTSEEKMHSQFNDGWTVVDDPAFERLRPVTHIYLTGDNCRQPDDQFVASLLREFEKNRSSFPALFKPSCAASSPAPFLRFVRWVRDAFEISTRILSLLQRANEQIQKRVVVPVLRQWYFQSGDRNTPNADSKVTPTQRRQLTA